MRILMLSRDASGLDQTSRTAARWRLLRDQGAELEVFISSSQKSVWQEDGIRVQGTGGQTVFQRFFRLYRLATTRALMVDLITAQDPFELGLIAWRIARHAAKRFEIQDHGGFFDGFPAEEPLWWLRSRLARFIVRRATGVRTVSPNSLKQLQIVYKKEDAYFLPIATEVRFTTADRHPDPYLIVSVARLVPGKGLDLLLHAFVEFQAIHPAARLIFVGEGRLRLPLERLARDLGIAEAVHFEGKADPLPFLERAAAFVLLSRHEGWGLAAVEAALVGVPVLMSNTGCAEWLQTQGRARVISHNATPAEISQLLSQLIEQGAGGTLQGALNAEEAAQKQITAWTALIEKKPRTLICVQAVDEQDPLMGFFVDWLRAFSQNASALVCALRVSDPLPHFDGDVDIRCTRSKLSRSRLAVLWRVACVSWRERFRYESVFIRGDVQYVVCLGWLWRLLGKRVVLWYAHYTARSWWYWIAAHISHVVVTSVAEGSPYAHSIPIGQAINTDIFTPSLHVRDREKKPRILIIGRLSPVKRVPWIIEAIRPLLDNREVELRIVGQATEEGEAEKLRASLGVNIPVWINQSVAFQDIPLEYVNTDIMINATPGSLDKTILEAAASGILVLATAPAYKRELPDVLKWLAPSTQIELRDSLLRAIRMSASERQAIGLQLRDWVVRYHSLGGQVRVLTHILKSVIPIATCRILIKRALLLLIDWVQSTPQVGVRVLMFHAFDGKGVAAFDPDRLAEALLVLRTQGYVFHRFADFWSSAGWALPTKGKHVIITIDDATEDVLRALPVFQEFQIPFVLCTPSGISHLKTSDGLERRVLSLDELQRLVATGLVEIIAHGESHAHFTELGDQELKNELAASLSLLDACHGLSFVPVVAYPRGRVDARVRQKVKEVGFVGGLTTYPGCWKAQDDHFMIPRYPVLTWMHAKDVLDECEGRGDMLRKLFRL